MFGNVTGNELKVLLLIPQLKKSQWSHGYYVSDLLELTDLSKATVYNVLNSLSRKNYVSYNNGVIHVHGKSSDMYKSLKSSL